MESTFLCKENLENIYEYLNSQTVHSYNVNLDSNPKYKKIVKKLAKTIFKNLYSTVQNMSINEFNDLVVNKSIPFIKQNIDKDLLKVKTVDSNNNTNNIQNFNSHNVNYAEVDLSNLNNIDLTSSVTLSKDNKDNKDNKKKTKRAKKPKKKSDNDEYQEYLNDALEFETLIRKSNDKIKDNFKQLVKKTNNNFVKDCNIEDTNPFVMDRCATKDDVIEKGLSKSAFEQIVEKKTLDNINTTTTTPTSTSIASLRNNQNKNNENTSYPSSPISNENINSNSTGPVQTTSSSNLEGDGLLDYYDGTEMNYKKLFTQILVNQKDFSKNNKVESYEGEMYLPNLISNYGEEAPIQPLLYQNTNKGSEILNTYSLVVDSGTKDGSGNLSLSTVTMVGVNPWEKFRVDLEDTLKFDKITDVYLKSFSVIGATNTSDCLYFMLDIEEFNLQSYSNNSSARSKIAIQNTITGISGATGVFTRNYTKFENYIATLTPSNFTTFNIELTNQDGEGADNSADSKTFYDQDAVTNRVIFELDFVTRRMKDPIFDYTITKDTADMVQSA